MILPCQRELFEIPEDISYLNCAYLSPSLKTVTEAGIEGVLRKAKPWEVRPQHFFDETEEYRDLAGRLIGSDGEGIAIIPGVSYGIETAARNVPIEKNQEILILAEQYPSNVYSWLRRAKEVGAKVVQVPRTDDLNWTEAVLERISEKTAVVALPNCHWTDGSLVDLKRVREATREVGAAFVLDTSQSLGAHPLDVKELDPDFMATVGYKWLMGPFSLGFLYVSPRYWEGIPLESNWISRVQSQDFAKLVEYRDAFQPGARRYDVAQRSNFALMPMAVAALKQIHKWGVENIADTLEPLTRKIEIAVKELGLTAVESEKRVGHIVGIGFKDGLPEGILDRLAKDKVFASIRGRSIRVAPHVYNTEKDIDRLIQSIKHCL